MLVPWKATRPPRIAAARADHGLPRTTRCTAPAAGAPLAGEAVPHEERKLVSVLFVDLVGFTAAAEAAGATRFAIDYDVLAPVTAKGKAEPLAMWLATGVVDDPGDRPARRRPRGIPAAFGETLAPARATTLLASPAARELLDGRS